MARWRHEPCDVIIQAQPKEIIPDKVEAFVRFLLYDRYKARSARVGLCCGKLETFNAVTWERSISKPNFLCVCM